MFVEKMNSKELLWPKISAAVFYGFCSASMAFANKAVMSSYGFNFPFTIMAIQMLASIIVVLILQAANIIKLPRYTLERGRQFIIPSICATLHSALSLVALQGMNIPMYAALKRCSPAVNLVLSVVVLRKAFPPLLIILSISLVTLGCLVAGFGDLSFDVLAYSVGSISVLVQGLYQTLIQKAAEKNFSVSEIFQLNCYNCLPMFVAGCIIMQEPMEILDFQYRRDWDFVACFTVVVLLGSIHNYSLFLSTSLNSALTTSLVGVLKSILQTVIGFFTFGGVPYNPINVAGIVLNTLGGVLYTFAKFREHGHNAKLPLKENIKTSNNGIQDQK